ncbi:MAG TPA: hypothetical protein VIG80_05205 [Bacillaceae bacterium]
MAIVSLMLIFLVFFLPAMLFARIGNPSSKLLRRKKVAIGLLLGYVGLLVLAGIVYEWLPGKNPELKMVGEREADETGNQLYEDLLEGRIDSVAAAYIKDEWDFEVTGNSLRIFGPSEHYSDVEIVVERKQEEDGRVEGFSIAHAAVDGMDLTSEMVRIGVEPTGDTLTIINSGETRLDFQVIKKDFVVNQFTGEKSSVELGHSMTSRQILYLRIPRNLDLVNDQGLFLNYVGH